MTCIPFLHNSCCLLSGFTVISFCEWLYFYSKIPHNKSQKYSRPDHFLAHIGPYWTQFTASFWLVALSTGSNYTSLLAANLCFSVATFWYKLVQFLGDNIESFPQLFSNEVSNSLPFLLWIHLRVSRLWAILLWKCINFFALHGGFLHITSFIGILQGSFFQRFKVHGFMDVCAKFLN